MRGDWIVTMDEDGQHDPASIQAMLDDAMAAWADVVYAMPTNRPQHGRLRNEASRLAKRLLRLTTSGTDVTLYQSLRLVVGEVGRSVAAYTGAGVYLDFALGCVARRVITSPVELRNPPRQPSGHSCAPSSRTSGRWCCPAAPGHCGCSACSAWWWRSEFCCSRPISSCRRSSGKSTSRRLAVVLLVCSGAILFSLGVIA